MFSILQVVVSTLFGGVAAAYVTIWLHARRTRVQVTTVDSLLLGATVAFSILLWREAGNVQMLNDDPIPVASPNDVLCPVVTDVCLGMLNAFRSAASGAHWPRIRALLALVSLVVNVVTI
jgi:hypothetical protein